MPPIMHLVEECAAPALLRELDWICGDPVLAETARHVLVRGRSGAFAGRQEGAGAIVSHLPASWRFLPGLMTLRALNVSVPLVHVEHQHCEAHTQANVAARRRHFGMLRSIYALFDRVVALSDSQADWMVRNGLISAASISVVQPCLDLAPFRALQAVAGPISHFALVGRCDRQSGFDIAIDAFRSLPSGIARLRIFAEGNAAEMQALRVRSGPDLRISIHDLSGGAGGRERAAAIGQCDAVLVPARWAASAAAALEARAAGRVLAVAPVDGLRDQGRLSGALVSPGNDASAWASLLGDLLCCPVTVPLRDGSRAMPEERSRHGWGRLLERLGEGGAGPEARVAV